MSETDLHLGSNIRTITWARQNDVLGHSSVQVFVTHGGNNSVYEAAFHAVPLVLIPCVADQGDNAVKVRQMMLCIEPEYSSPFFVSHVKTGDDTLCS